MLKKLLIFVLGLICTSAQNAKIQLFPTIVPVPALPATNCPKIVPVLALLVKMLLLIVHALTPQGQTQMKIKF